MIGATIETIIALIALCYLLRWGHCVVVKRQRIDWAVEREHFKQHLKLMLRIMRRLSRYYFRGWRGPKHLTHKSSGHSH